MTEMKDCKVCGHIFFKSCTHCRHEQFKKDMHQRHIEWNRSSNSTGNIEERIEKIEHDIKWKKEIDNGHFHPRHSTNVRLDKITVEELEAKISRLRVKLAKRS